MHVYTGHLTFTPRFDLDAPLAQLQQVLADALQGCDALDRRACESFLAGLVSMHRLAPVFKTVKRTDHNGLPEDECRFFRAAHAKLETQVQTLHCDVEEARARNAGKDVSNV